MALHSEDCRVSGLGAKVSPLEGLFWIDRINTSPSTWTNGSPYAYENPALLQFLDVARFV